MTTLILGIGNPILGDDGAGIRVIQDLRESGLFADNKEVDLKEIATGGIPLVEFMLDYDHVVLIDALEGLEPGEVRELDPTSLDQHVNGSGVHDLDFRTSLELLQSVCPDRMPGLEDITIFGIGIGENTEFSEELSPPVERGVEEAVDRIRAKYGSRVEEDNGFK